VIEVLEQQGIRPDFIVGTSAGSIVGSIYASGKSPAELRDIALKLKANDVREVNVSLKGFFDGKKVEDYINEQVHNLPMKNSPKSNGQFKAKASQRKASNRILP